MELTCTSFSFPLLSLARSMQVIALLNIGYVDLGAHLGGSHLQPDRIEFDPIQQADEVKRAAEEAGIGIADLFPTFGDGFRDRPVNTPDAATRRANRERFASFITFCEAVGCPGITLLPGVIWEDLSLAKSLDLAVQALRELVEEGRSAGLRVSIEPHLESVVEDPERALELVQSVPGLQFTLDYGHFIAADIPASQVHPLISYTGHLHARQAAPGLLQAAQTEGTIDYQDVVQRLFNAGYQGFLSVEYTWQEWRGCNRLDVLSESALMRDQLRTLLKQQAA